MAKGDSRIQIIGATPSAVPWDAATEAKMMAILDKSMPDVMERAFVVSEVARFGGRKYTPMQVLNSRVNLKQHYVNILQLYLHKKLFPSQMRGG